MHHSSECCVQSRTTHHRITLQVEVPEGPQFWGRAADPEHLLWLCKVQYVAKYMAAFPAEFRNILWPRGWSEAGALEASRLHSAEKRTDKVYLQSTKNAMNVRQQPGPTSRHKQWSPSRRSSRGQRLNPPAPRCSSAIAPTSVATCHLPPRTDDECGPSHFRCKK